MSEPNADYQPTTDPRAPTPGFGDVPARESELPSRLGRYRVEKLLGKGGFGYVYLAYDEELRRKVAIKVPRRERVSRPEDIEAFLAEARMLAGLDHPNIVPVHDAGRTEGGGCFVVSKFIAGSDLAARILSSRPTAAAAAELVATVALALHYSHGQGIVHRDMKPGNILIDAAGKPYVADFGLAMTDADFGTGPGFAGTPAYMSPEQARGEGHRVDGRSDIFSLGVVFYELLTGRRPFIATTSIDLLEQIATVEARPPRQLDDSIPRELERICLKALGKRASERYTTAKDLADDLRHFLAATPAADSSWSSNEAPADAAVVNTPPPSPVPTPVSHPVKIVPKGLRAFDAGDADFFLELLPGPRDRDGLPDSIRFWKARIEETDADQAFTVGLMYGPSGCGKSSFVKAGLLPRLASHVVAVYVEATPDDTEARVLRGLRKRCPALPEMGLKETLAALRRGQGLPPDRKVLIVLDQFEQWLHAHATEPQTELVQALRQCDGGRVQCLLTVRDDFWLAVSRFLDQLEVRLVQGHNSALIDLFDPEHARRVLAAYGRAYGRLPGDAAAMEKEHKVFLERAVRELTEEGKVVCVRLALFAEMMKGKPWTPGGLKAVGGTSGVGVTFLEETFSAATAPPAHRYHQAAARAVLKSLLPQAGTAIKGHMRAEGELLAASGYGDRPREFAELLRILDAEVRLITPTDPAGSEAPAPAGVHYFQLTHDYLVPSLREWLTRKQRETRRGRAELRLADRAAVWSARPETRLLPALWEWANIRLFSRRKDWTAAERKLMRRATRYYLSRAAVAAIALVLIGWGGIEAYGRFKAQALVERLLVANTSDVPTVVRDMDRYRRWVGPLLETAHAEALALGDNRKALHTSLAQLPTDSSQSDYLYKRLLAAEPHEVEVLRRALHPHWSQFEDGLWAEAEHPQPGEGAHRLRAGSALALYQPDSPRWANVRQALTDDLVAVPAVHLATWADCLRPVRGQLLPPLVSVFRDAKRRETERSLATDLIADYAADQPQVLAYCLMDAEPRQFAVIHVKVKEQQGAAVPLLDSMLEQHPRPDTPEAAKEQLAKRQANAATALYKLGGPEKAWPLLKHTPDPRVRSYLIHRLAAMGADPRPLASRLDGERDITIRRALLLSLGEFGENDFPAGDREALVSKVKRLYANDDDAGLHAAAEWLLRQWGQDAWLKQSERQRAQDQHQRDQGLDKIRQQLAAAQQSAKLQPLWYVNGQGQTMVVIPGPVEFLMGSPPGEAGRQVDETQHHRRIGRTFAIAAKPVTVEQYRRFEPGYHVMTQYAPTEDCPVHGTNWYMAAEYCNWLSRQEGLPETEWCYEPNKSGKYADGVMLAPDYLKRLGYRLLTEAEWEFACRAGATTSRYYGETEELLGKYAWYLANASNRSWPVGRPKPNDSGLFDIQGNVWTWCQETERVYPSGSAVIEDKEDSQIVNDSLSRVLRGGSFDHRASSVRSAFRSTILPSNRDFFIGLRPARTFR